MEILYEDKSCFVVNKPAGLLVHPAAEKFGFDNTLVGLLRAKIKWDDSSDIRPGIIHRLDKDTSGALVIAKNREAYKNLVDQFKKRQVEKEYIALVRGIPKHKEAVIDSPIGRSLKDRKKMALSNESLGKKAVTQYKVVKEFDGASLLKVQIKTGRTHQIRVHMAGIGYPVIGDETYGDKGLNKIFKEKFGLNRQFLHAEMLKFVSPATSKTVIINCDLPIELKDILTKL